MSIPNRALPDEAALCRFLAPDGEAHLGWLDQPNRHSQKPPVLVDLTRVSEGVLTTVAQVLSYVSWHSYYTVSPVPISDVASMVVLAQPEHLDIPRPVWDDFSRWLSLTVPASFVLPLDAVTLLAPVDAQEVWIAGGSDAHGQEASGAARPHARLHAAEPPAGFREGDAHLIAGPGQAVRAHSGIERTVAGPALALLLNGQGGIAGYTIGNEVGKPTAESEGPAYALGPWVVPAEYLPKVEDRGVTLNVYDPDRQAIVEYLPRAHDVYNRRVTCGINRDGAALWQGETCTAELRPRPDELASDLSRARSFPGGAYLLASIPLAPPDTVGLRGGDVVEVAIEGLGALRNPVN